MKAVIMAGGEGTRLRPITGETPKPMVKICDRPVLEHIIELLKRNGINDICITLRYLPEKIKSYFGDGSAFNVNITYSEELRPLGTAGGVKKCADFIGGGDFLVISGDCLCSFDLENLISRHKGAGAAATIALTSFPTPTEYGLVVTGADGRIEKFIEKPSYDKVVTDLVNTGVYVLSADALELIPDGKSYDFGRDFFPAALESGLPLYGFQCGGYWCDIGNAPAYLQANFDSLDGKTGVLPGKFKGGVYSLSSVPDYCRIYPPCYIGKDVKLGAGASVGPYAVIGDHARVGDGARIRSSVCSGCDIGSGADIFGAYIADGCSVGQAVTIEKNAVIGARVTIGGNSKIFEGVTISSDISVACDSEVRFSLTGAAICGAPLFSEGGEITLPLKSEGLESSILRLGQALSAFGKVGIGCAPESEASAAADILSGGVRFGGGSAYIFGGSFPGCAAFAAYFYGLDAAVFIGLDDSNLYLSFYDRYSLPFSRYQQRKIEYPSPVKRAGAGEKAYLSGCMESYGLHCLKNFDGVCCSGLKVSIPGRGSENRLLKKVLEQAGADIVSAQRGVVSFSVSPDGSLTASDESGIILDGEKALLCALRCMMVCGKKELSVPKDAPAALRYMAEQFGCRLISPEKDRQAAGAAYAGTPYDGVFLACVICSYMAKENIPLSDISSKIPPYHIARGEISLPGSAASFLRYLRTSAFSEAAAEFDDGLKILYGKSFASLTPSFDGNSVKVKTESDGERGAKQMLASIEKLAENMKTQ